MGGTTFGNSMLRLRGTWDNIGRTTSAATLADRHGEKYLYLCKFWEWPRVVFWILFRIFRTMSFILVYTFSGAILCCRRAAVKNYRSTFPRLYARFDFGCLVSDARQRGLHSADLVLKASWLHDKGLEK